MRIISVLFYCMLFNNAANAQLKKVNEVIIHAFQTTSRKWVYICKDKNDRYIVYRFGTDKKIELQYPAELNKQSWDKFSFRSYIRGGGPENSGTEFQNLDFTNNGISYSVYNIWEAKTERTKCFVDVETAKRILTIRGIWKTHINLLSDLIGNTKLKEAE